MCSLVKAHRRPDACGRIVDRAACAMPLQNDPHQIKPQPAAACLAIARTFLAIKRIKEMGQRVLANMNAGVFDDERRRIVSHSRPDADVFSAGRIERGVGKQISDRLCEHRALAIQHQRWREISSDT